MKNKTEVIDGMYKSTYEQNYLWNSIIEKLTLRQAYVYYYALAHDDEQLTALKLGTYDLPDKTMVHKRLMDALLKKENPREIAQKIGDNAHKILISDNDLIWVKQELRAALWLSHSMARVLNGGDAVLLDLLQSTNGIEFTNRLIHVLDIHGCRYKEDKALRIRIDLNNSNTIIVASHLIAFNHYRGHYILNRISDAKLNWLNKLPEDEIDIIIERLKEEKILVLDGVFIPVIKKDKIEIIKSSLDIQNNRYKNKILDRSILRPYMGEISIYKKEEKEKNTIKKKIEFLKISSDKILDLLKKAHSSREYRRDKSSAKINNGIVLNKESHNIINRLSEQLGATPKKIIEAMIRKVNLEDEQELSEIDKLISGKRASKMQSILEQSSASEPEERFESEEPTEPIELEEDLKLEEDVLKIESKKKVARKSQAAALLNFRMASKK